MSVKDGNRSRTDFSGASKRRMERRTKKRADFEADTRKRGRVPTGRGGDIPERAVPQRPPFFAIMEDLFKNDEIPDEELPEAIYGQYPKWFLGRIEPWFGCPRAEVLHVCSGSLPPGEGVRVDIRAAAKPDVIADGRNLPFRDGSFRCVMFDPPYTPGYAKELYGIEYPRPGHLLREGARVLAPGGRLIFVH
jgi:hypothetical protein